VQSHVAYGVIFIRGVLPHERLCSTPCNTIMSVGMAMAITRDRRATNTLLGRMMQVAECGLRMMLDGPTGAALAGQRSLRSCTPEPARQFDPALVAPFIAAVETTLPRT